MPWHSSGADDLLPPVRDPIELAFDLQPVGTIVSAGSRVRVTLTGADRASHRPPDLDPPPIIRVRHGEGHASRIELPVLPGVADDE